MLSPTRPLFTVQLVLVAEFSIAYRDVQLQVASIFMTKLWFIPLAMSYILVTEFHTAVKT